jgi:hypothetical protein
MKTLEQVLIAQREMEKYVWLLDNKQVDINSISAHKLKEAIDARATEKADPDGPLWAGSGNFSDIREAYACCAVAFGILRLVTQNEWVLFQSMAEMAEEIEALDVQSMIDGKEVEVLTAEVSDLKNRIERIENGKRPTSD